MKSVSKYFVLICILMVFLSGCVGETKEKEVYRVGIIGGVAAFSDIANGFKAGMTKLGYIEGENIVYDVRVENFDPSPRPCRRGRNLGPPVSPASGPRSPAWC